jgi:hypothetical protein
MKCRICGTTFLGEPDVVGQPVCLACRQRITAAPLGNRPTADTTFTDRLSAKAEVEPSGPARLGRVYADHAGVDLDEASEPEVESAAVATRLLQEWKLDLPAVPSAYQPSGVLPIAALIAMTVGAGLGVVLSTLADLVAGVIAFTGIVLFHASLTKVPSRWVAILAGVLMLLAGTMPFVVGGWVSSRITTLLGRIGNNRNAGIAQCLSVTSAGLAVAIAAGMFYAFGRRSLDDWLSVHAEDPGFRIVYVGGAALAATIAMGAAGFFAARHVLAEKFCEDCEVFMSRLKVKSLRLGALRAIIQAARERNTEVAVSLLYSEAGSDGTVELFQCPRCGRGFVEVTAHFKAQWRGQDGGKKRASWLVTSLELPSTEMERFPVSPCDEDEFKTMT